jgi:hypothetical protein
MSKNKAHGKAKKKSSQLVIRLEKAERDAFVSLCDRLDTSAAREIRRFMRELVAAHSNAGAASSASEALPVDEAADRESASVDAAATAIASETEAVSGDADLDEAEKPKRKQKRAAK